LAWSDARRRCPVLQTWDERRMEEVLSKAYLLRVHYQQQAARLNS
jgi:hypothetical protein